MSTPEDKLVAAAGEVKGAIEKAKSLWQDYRVYIACLVCFLIGAFLGHKI